MKNNLRTFENLGAAVDDLGFSGKDFVKSVQDLYSIYNHDVVEWLAGIYDNKSGGFYYSNSARDNDGFLPDIESTNQATKSGKRSTTLMLGPKSKAKLRIRSPKNLLFFFCMDYLFFFFLYNFLFSNDFYAVDQSSSS